jgi:hypothetical protein
MAIKAMMSADPISRKKCKMPACSDRRATVFDKESSRKLFTLDFISYDCSRRMADTKTE